MKCSGYACLALLPLILIGCGSADNIADLQRFMADVKERPVDPLEPIPSKQVYAPFTYQAALLRSPFQSAGRVEQSITEKPVIALQPVEVGTQHVAEGFNIERFAMVGLLSNSRVSYALLRSEKGVQRVAVGDYLAGQYVRVTTITASSVDIVESVADGNGGWIERLHTLFLQERS